MTRKNLSFLCMTILAVAALFAFHSFSDAVPVIPNEAVINGTVLEYCITSAGITNIKPEQVLYKLVISIEKAEDVKGYPNFLKGKEGQVLTFYMKEKQDSDIYGKKVKAVIEYKGDERGGIFWIKNIESIK